MFTKQSKCQFNLDLYFFRLGKCRQWRYFDVVIQENTQYRFCYFAQFVLFYTNLIYLLYKYSMQHLLNRPFFVITFTFQYFQIMLKGFPIKGLFEIYAKIDLKFHDSVEFKEKRFSDSFSASDASKTERKCDSSYFLFLKNSSHENFIFFKI